MNMTQRLRRSFVAEIAAPPPLKMESGKRCPLLAKVLLRDGRELLGVCEECGAKQMVAFGGRAQEMHDEAALQVLCDVGWRLASCPKCVEINELRTVENK